ncbi:hypothetical protein EC973_000326 [Apophysomyces ossiformis]|uniref:Elongation of fatty acids protein n=1 Tax=Apophysomyces ossiformis TaxID=679940 RepID=A0A8H7BRI2_9FUNG|nr:hypothetical protein EC973_000326 [Apophysomyces ossiformis]
MSSTARSTGLYPLFAQVYGKLIGPASEFRFTPGVTPLATFREGFILYFVVIFGGQYLMTNRAPVRLSLVNQIHNFLLTVVSGALLIMIGEQILPKIYRHGLFYGLCDDDAYSQPLELLYYLNYLVKYWEFLDTVFLMLKKKKLGLASCYAELISTRIDVLLLPTNRSRRQNLVEEILDNNADCPIHP